MPDDLTVPYLRYLRDAARYVPGLIRDKLSDVRRSSRAKKCFQVLGGEIQPTPAEFGSVLKKLEKWESRGDPYQPIVGFGLVVGKIKTTSGQDRHIAAPLMYCTAELVRIATNGAELNIKWKTTCLNYDLLSLIVGRLDAFDEEKEDDFQYAEAFQPPPLDVLDRLDREIKELAARGNPEADFSKKWCSDLFESIHNQVRECSVIQQASSPYNPKQLGIYEQSSAQFFPVRFFCVSGVSSELGTIAALDDLIQQAERNSSEPFRNPLLSIIFQGRLADQRAPVRGTSIRDEEINSALDALPILLSQNQRHAVWRAWRREVSYVQGPPGTGKSHTITAIMLCALLLNKRVLLVSHKQAAIDVVAEMLGKYVDRKLIVEMPREKDALEKIHGNLVQLLGNAEGSWSATELQNLQEKRKTVQSEVSRLAQEIREIRVKIEKELEKSRDYHTTQERFATKRANFAGRFPPAQGGEIKLSARTDPAAAQHFLEHLWQLHRRCADSVPGHSERRVLFTLKRFFTGCENDFYADGDRLRLDESGSLYLKELFELTKLYQDLTQIRNGLNVDLLQNARGIHEEKSEELQKSQKEFIRLQFQIHVREALENKSVRGDIWGLAGIFSALKRGKLPDLASFNPATVTKALPLWMGQMRDLGKFLPFEPGLFDLVIVDEASQVNIAEIVPAFYRGCGFCIVGDHKQLGLNSAGFFFINRRFEQLTWQRHFGAFHIPYEHGEENHLLMSKHSILDFIGSYGSAGIPQTTLNEHFRSLPQLASFTSDEFYSDDGGLCVMKELPQNFPLSCFRPISTGGKREIGARVVPLEVDEVMAWLKRFSKDEFCTRDELKPHGFTPDKPPSLGVISFLTDQRDEIRKNVEKEFTDYERQRFHLLVGTPEDFQGNERDIMFITLGLDGTQTRLNQWQDRPRFNVATSRAIHFAYLIYGGLPGKAELVIKYLNHFGFKPDSQVEKKETTILDRYRWKWGSDRCESEFEHRVFDCLEEFRIKNGGADQIELYNQVPACGQKRLDFVVFNKTNGVCVAVEADGQDHFVQDTQLYCEAHLERVAILRRAGWRIVHVPYHRWWNDGRLCNLDEPALKPAKEDLFNQLRGAI
jgi:hypothetical protein